MEALHVGGEGSQKGCRIAILIEADFRSRRLSPETVKSRRQTFDNDGHSPFRPA